MANKLKARLRRARKTRFKIANSRTHKLTIARSSRHIRVQLISLENKQHKVLAEASSLEQSIISLEGDKTAKAIAVGKLIAEKAKKVGVESVAFDRSGYPYHGRVQALADAAREGGLDF